MGNPAPSAVTLPTIGRVVYLYDRLGAEPEKPYTAFVADVSVNGNPLTINCACLTHTGDAFIGGFQGVPHKSDPLDSRVYWDWMPYQKGQAAKTEALEAKLEAK